MEYWKNHLSNVKDNIMNVLQSVRLWVVFATVCILLSGCRSNPELDAINFKVNNYGYLSDDEYGEGGMKLMSPTQRGDCEDFAYTKCLMINELYPNKEVYYLYRRGSRGKLAHAAMAVDGMVLDNQHRLLYPYVEAEWTSATRWLACSKITH